MASVVHERSIAASTKGTGCFSAEPWAHTFASRSVRQKSPIVSWRGRGSGRDGTNDGAVKIMMVAFIDWFGKGPRTLQQSENNLQLDPELVWARR